MLKSAANRSTRKQSGSSLAKPEKLTCHAKEELLRSACNWLRSSEGRNARGKPNYTEAHHKFGVPYSTLHDRYNRKHKATTEAHEAQMLLSLEQERAMVEWMKKDAQEGHPWTRVKIKLRVRELSGIDVPPSNKWVQAFNRRHNDILHFRSTAGLDPIRARCFNAKNMEDHFTQYGAIQDRYRIKINLDETGSQLGGGRRNSGRKCYTVRGDSAKYRQRDANLELVTVIEACSADGEMMDPGFIFNAKGGWTTDWWGETDNKKIS